MSNKKFISALAIFCVIVLTLCASGCKSGSTATNDEPTEIAATLSATGDEVSAEDALASLGIDASSLGIAPEIHRDSEHRIGFQLDAPEEGEAIAVIRTDLGDITLRLFPEQAPKTVTNFINLSKAGKYDGTAFHRVINDFIIQGGHCGDNPEYPNGESSYGSDFEDEFCDRLFNIRGAVSMANSSKDSNGSQFFINQTDADAFKSNGGWATYEDWWSNVKTQLLNYKDSTLLADFIAENGDKCYDTDLVPDRVRTMYELYGGNPNLDGAFNAADRGNTVFAQVIEGMGVVDKIAAAKTDKDDVPETPVMINSIEIKTYSVNGEAEQIDAGDETTAQPAEQGD